MNFNNFTLRQDLFGGLTSAIVALPLALAFGVATALEGILKSLPDRDILHIKGTTFRKHLGIAFVILRNV